MAASTTRAYMEGATAGCASLGVLYLLVWQEGHFLGTGLVVGIVSLTIWAIYRLVRYGRRKVDASLPLRLIATLGATVAAYILLGLVHPANYVLAEISYWFFVVVAIISSGATWIALRDP